MYCTDKMVMEISVKEEKNVEYIKFGQKNSESEFDSSTLRKQWNALKASINRVTMQRDTLAETDLNTRVCVKNLCKIIEKVIIFCIS